jgi:hypothetical protein
MSVPDELAVESALTVTLPPVLAAIWPKFSDELAVRVSVVSTSAEALAVAEVAAEAAEANETALRAAPTRAIRSVLRMIIMIPSKQSNPQHQSAAEWKTLPHSQVCL